MKVADILRQKKTFSFEVFPPKAEQPTEPLKNTLKRLYAFRPDFVSCTYGAGGTNKGRNEEIVGAIQASGKTEAVTHFTCVGNTREDILAAMERYRALGVENVLALRGDLPADWTGTNGDFAHADELIRFLSDRCPSFCLGAAGYPETHVAAQSPEKDVEYLKSKQDGGASFCMTQLCHDADVFLRFVERVRKLGITMPVIAGVMPVLKKDAIIRMTVPNGCSIPPALQTLIDRYGDDADAFKSAGKEFTAALIKRYQEAGVDGIHIYTLNRYEDVADILETYDIRHADAD